MKLFLWAAALVLVLGIGTASAAHDQVKCGPLDTAQEYLKNQHGEVLKFTGVSSEGHLIMMFYNEESGAFSFGIVQPFNPTAICPVDQGNDGKFHEKSKGDSL